MPKTRSKGKPHYEFDAEAIAQRRVAGESWKAIADALGLKGPGAARTAYTDLTGRHHNDIDGAPIIGKRKAKADTNGAAPKPAKKAKGSVTDATPSQVDTSHVSPGWNADSDQDELIARLEPIIKHDDKGREYVAHATTLIVQRKLRTEELTVHKLIGFHYNKDETRLAVEFHDGYNGSYRCVYVDDIVEVY